MLLLLLLLLWLLVVDWRDFVISWMGTVVRARAQTQSWQLKFSTTNGCLLLVMTDHAHVRYVHEWGLVAPSACHARGTPAAVQAHPTARQTLTTTEKQRSPSGRWCVQRTPSVMTARGLGTSTYVIHAMLAVQLTAITTYCISACAHTPSVMTGRDVWNRVLPCLSGRANRYAMLHPPATSLPCIAASDPSVQPRPATVRRRLTDSVPICAPIKGARVR